MIKVYSGLTHPVLFVFFTPPGWYIYIDASGKADGDSATLLSEDMTGDKCVSWWFHMYGANVNVLNVHKIVGTSRTLEWSRRGNQGTDWMYGQVFVTGTFYVRCLTYLFFSNKIKIE